MFTRAVRVACTILLLAAGSANAQEDYERNGVYTGVAGTAAFEHFQGTGGLDFDESLGLNLRLGYRFHPNLAAELQYEWAEGFDLSGGGAPVDSWALTANAKAYLETGRIQPLLLLGVGVMQAEGSVTGFGNDKSEGFVARFGGGIDFYVTENIVVNLEVSYLRPSGDVSGVDYVSFSWGVLWRF